MILSNVEIHKAIDEKRLVIEPEPLPRQKPIGGGHCPYDTHTVDLRLSPEIVVPDGGKFTYDLAASGNLAQLIKQHSKTLTISGELQYILEPGTYTW